MGFFQRYQARKLLKKENVIGYAVNPDNGKLDVYVAKKVPEDELKSKDIVPKKTAGRKTDVIESQMPRAVGVRSTASTIYQTRVRPYQPGHSISSIRSDVLHAGTFGFVAKRTTYEFAGMRVGALVGRMLSAALRDKFGFKATTERVGVTNRHVVNEFGSQVVQPGTLDDGNGGFKNLIGRVVAHSQFRTKDPVDASLFSMIQGEFKDWPINLRDCTPSRGTATVKVGDVVKKSGRTSALTYGQVLNTGVTMTVNMGEYGNITFHDLIEMYPAREGDNAMLLPGDSGSAIYDTQGRLVGLGFAAGPTNSYAIPIQKVLGVMGIEY